MLLGDVAAIRRILSDLSPQEREALTRFYVLEQSTADILRELKMDADEFKELKHIARKRWQEHWQQRKRVPRWFEKFLRDKTLNSRRRP